MSEETLNQSTNQGAAPVAAPVSNQITIEEFAKVQLRVGQILEAEKIEGSRKLMKLRVDIGIEVRQLVAGIAEAYEPASLINRKIVVVANLKPAKLMGVESNGMVVAASVDGKPVLATFAEDVPNGALLK
jgi:methionyl-tRNA synthetase